MFNQLPETNPIRNPKKKKALMAAAIMHVLLVAGIILVQMALPEKLGEFQLLTTLYMAPPPPPPALGPAPVPKAPRKTEQRAVSDNPVAVLRQEPTPPTVSTPPELVAPTVVPEGIARIIDAEPGTGVIGGLPGGVAGGKPGGISGGILGGVVDGTGTMPAIEPPKAPVRVGGDVREPKIVKIVQPKYPPEARRARIEGVVILEATVTEQGTVEKIKVISGHPMLTAAAADAVQSWKYEPTILNGDPVAVILTAKVNFQLAAGR
jgi:periplasmic protein TonB